MDLTLDQIKHKLINTYSPKSRIRIFIHHHIGHYRDNYHESRLILHEAHHLPPEYSNTVKDRQRQYIALLSDNIKMLVAGYKNNPNRIRLLTFSLLGMCNWPYIWFNPKGSVSPEELAEEIYRIFVGELPIFPDGEAPPE